MIASKAKHPNCMYKWMDWIISPKVNAEVAEWFGEAPSNAKSCAETADKNHCETYHADDQAYFDKVSYWTTPRTQCGDDRGRCARTTPPGCRPGPRSRAKRTPLQARRRVQLGLLLSGPLGWLAVAYLGSLVVLFVSAFWQLDDFSGEIVKQPTLDNFKLLWETRRLSHDRAAGRSGSPPLVTVTDAILAFPIAFFMAKVASRACGALLVVGDPHAAVGVATWSRSTRGA